MNILFLYNSTIDPVKGGIERVTHVLADYFEEHGNKVFFLSRVKNSEYEDQRQYYLRCGKSFRNSENVDYLKNLIREKRIDLIINQAGMSEECSQFAYCAKELDVKIISFIHSSPLAPIKNFSSVYLDKASKLRCKFLLPLTNIKFVKALLLYLYKLKYQKHYKELCKNSDKVLLLSDKFIPELEFFVDGNYADKVDSIANPFSFAIDNISINLNEKKKEILYVGRVNFVEKRVDLLLRVWSTIFRQFPDWSLKIVGGGEGVEKAKKLSCSLGLDNVHFEGFQSPQKYYKSASVFCMTSSYEGFGIVLVEAMQYGVVPMAFNSYLSVTDVIDDGKNGLLIEPFNVDEYASALSGLIEDEECRLALAHRALKKAQDFSLDTVGEKWLSLLNHFS